MTIANSALLVSVAISTWSARKMDKTETRAVTAKHGATSSAASVHKNLLPMAMSLERVGKAVTAIRQEFYRRSLPWGDSGARVVHVTGYLDFVAAHNTLKYQWQSAVDDFLADYDQLRQDAKVFLNTLYNDADYPSLAEVKKKFAVDVSVLPIPEQGDFRVNMSDDVLAGLKAQLAKDVEASTAAAMQDAWGRIKDVVERARERLSDPDAVFRDSLVENATQLVAILPTLNIAGDPALDEVRRDLERSLCAVTPDQLRALPHTRKDVAAEMEAIMKKMGGLYGGRVG